MRPLRVLAPRPLGFDFARMRPLADECCHLIPDEARRHLLTGLSPMATLALAPVLMEMDGDEAVNIMERVKAVLEGTR